MTFEWPIVLFSLALIPILSGLYLLAQRRRRAYAVRFTNLALLQAVVGRTPGFRRHIPPLLYLIGLAALLFSLARPVAVIAVPREQTTIMLVLDVSGSMAADDLEPNRMAAAKEAAKAFVDQLPDTIQVGLVSFSSNAAVQASPTTDHLAVTQAIDQLRSRGGTAIGDGLDLALDQLVQRPTDANGQRAPGMVVLLSDGQSTQGMPPQQATARAQSEQVKVYTVGVGQRDAQVFVQNIPVTLDEETLQQIANETGGSYFYAAETTELERIYSDLGSQISWVEERTEITALISALGTVLLIAGSLLSLRWLQQFP